LNNIQCHGPKKLRPRKALKFVIAPPLALLGAEFFEQLAALQALRWNEAEHNLPRSLMLATE